MKKYKYEVSYRASLGRGSDGKYHYKRFTGHSNTSEQKALEDAKRQAERWKATHDIPNQDAGMRLSEAYKGYISMKEHILSPSTIRGYEQLRRNNLQKLMPMRIADITQQDVQRAINEEAQTHSPKSLRNMHGLLAAVLKMYRPDLVLHTTLPLRMPPELHIPDNSEIEQLLSYLKDTKPELFKAVLLAAFGSLRRSEIAALTSDDIDGSIVHVHKAMVPDKTHHYIIKEKTKSEAGVRDVTLPNEVIAYLFPADGSHRIVCMTPHMITKNFRIALERAEIPHFRFHDLRHYQASILHALGVPDKYIMERGGWKTDSTLKNIYQHTMSDKRKSVEDQICNYFSDTFKEL